MRIFKRAYQIVFILCVCSISLFSVAEQSQNFDNLQVHYIALPSTFLSAKMARQYAIKRSKYTAFINISVLDKKNDLKAVIADISGVGKNLIGQNETLTFNEIIEGTAIYYIASYPFNNEERVHFTINITAQNKNHTLKFQHKFYVD